MELKEITPLEKKSEFILQRAEGLSYDKISKELGISKSTCSNWEKELKEEINNLKSQQLNDLYERYYMTREARTIYTYIKEGKIKATKIGKEWRITEESLKELFR